MKKKKLLSVLLLATALIAGTAGAQDITTGLTGHWKLNDGSGINAIDSSPNGNDGTLVNGPVWVAGPSGFGGALDFDGSDDFVDIGTLNASTTDELSISAWAYCKGTGASNESGCIVAKRTSYDTTVFQFVRAKDGRIAMTRPGNYSTFEAVMPLDEWMHITFTCDSSGVSSIYFNGILAATNTWAVAPPSDAPAYIGMAWPYYDCGLTSPGTVC